jgi:hypothetical protein
MLSTLESADQQLEQLSQVVKRMRVTFQDNDASASANRQNHLTVLQGELAKIIDSTEHAVAPAVLGLSEPEFFEHEEATAEARLDDAMGIIHQSQGTIAASKFEIDLAIRGSGRSQAPKGETNVVFEGASDSAQAAQSVAAQIRQQPEVATLSQANGLSTAAMRLLG